MKKILIIFGTRPEAIKMAPLIKELENHKDKFYTEVCVTGQHKEMLSQVLDIFKITPDYDLSIMSHGQDLYDITEKIIQGMKGVLNSSKPDLVLVHGDTTTTFTASLAAFYQKIKIGHIEAGLRTDNKFSPWPEEANRRLTSVLADYHFSPTNSNKDNLLKENIQDEYVYVTGNTVIDALNIIVKRFDIDQIFQQDITKSIKKNGFSNIDKKYILVTGHRRESIGQGFIDICSALKTIAERNPMVDIVYPVHLNPNIKSTVVNILSNIPNIFLINPLQYEEFILLMQKSYMVLTDSGGIQEEAPGLGKPVLVMRDTTERSEAVDAGTVKLVGTNALTIVKEVQELLDNSELYVSMSNAINPYGAGDSSKQIRKILETLPL
jgi:UDP-N-acetylglucosamine 2-epimerase (non-hydrolysing)